VKYVQDGSREDIYKKVQGEICSRRFRGDIYEVQGEIHMYIQDGSG